MLAYEPAPAGSAEAREAVCGYYAARGHAVAPGRVLLTASTSEAYSYLFKLLTRSGRRGAGAEPVVPAVRVSRRYGVGDGAALSAGVSRGWRIDMAAVEAAVTPRTRAIVLVNPNNPTGSYVKRAELARADGVVRGARDGADLR